MIESSIFLAIKSRLDTWTETDMVIANTVYTPVATRPYVFAQFVGLDTDIETLSYNCGNEYRGLLNLSVFVPINTATLAQHLGLANRVGALFPAGTKLTYQTTTAEIFQTPRIIGNSLIDNSHNRLEVQVNYRAWG